MNQEVSPFALPLFTELSFFFSVMEPVGSERRTSSVQGKYHANIGSRFGPTNLVIAVDRAIMACTRWWVHNYSTSIIEEDDVFKGLLGLFSKINFNGRNPKGDNPLVPELYLKAFLELKSSEKSENGNKGTMCQRYHKLFQKAIRQQYCDIFILFKHSPPSLVHHSLHQYEMGGEPLLCPFPSCHYCKGCYPGNDSIFGFYRFVSIIF